MKSNGKIYDNRPAKRQPAGFALLDVILAMAVFAFGMLALVQLQGSLARVSADANVRTVAASVAEEMVERLRGYRSVLADPDNGLVDFMEMNGAALSDTVDIQLGGDGATLLQFTRTVSVTNFWWDDANDTFIRTETMTPPTGVDRAYPNFKLLKLDVSWGNSDDFYVSDTATADLETGSITIYEIISSTPASVGAQLASPLDGDTGPVVVYNPGDNPDIIALKLNDAGKFKEATSAQPRVIRDENIETWFDVVTYSDSNRNDEIAEFLRREEFLVVSCECTLNNNPDPVDYGYLPTVWNGISYTEGDQVQKPVGVAISNAQQSSFCGICCRDHHDVAGGNVEQKFNPAISGPSGDHPHYDRDNTGKVIPTAVSDGDSYVEACRLIRKDGFMRVTQDANQGTLIGFPEGYLEFDEGAGKYSDYVIESVEDYYNPNGKNQTAFPQPQPGDPSSSFNFPARATGDATALPTTTFAESQQLRARAVYTDYLTAAAKEVIASCLPNSDGDFPDPPDPGCKAPNAGSVLEIYPFFDLQMTFLANWKDESMNNLVTISNDPIATDNPGTIGPDHSRGFAELVGGIEGQFKLSIKSEDGNLGLAAVAPISLSYTENVDSMFVDANGSSNPVPPIGAVVSGALTSGVKRVTTSKLLLTGTNALCGNSFTDWSCVVPPSGGSLTVSGYYLNNPRTYVCSSDATVARKEGGDMDSTTFTLPDGGAFDIFVTDDFSNCPY